MKNIIISIALFILAINCKAQDNTEKLYFDELKRIKEHAKDNLSENINGFNIYKGRPNTDGHINSTNVEAFLFDQIPYFLCSEEDFTEVYNYRWWMNSKHLRYWYDKELGKDVSIFTEFYGWPGHASISGAIPCPAGHQFYDLRWLRNPKYLQSFIDFYMKGYASKNNQRENRAFHSNISRPESHHYSSWMINGTEAFLKVHPNQMWRDELLPYLEKHQKVWDDKFTIKKEGSKTDGLYKVLDLYDGMEFTISATMALIESDGPYSHINQQNWKDYYLGWGPIDRMRKSELNQQYPKAFVRGYPTMYLARPSINSYYYGNLKSLSNLYELKASQSNNDSDKQLSKFYAQKAKEKQKKTLSTLWSSEDHFFNTYTAADNAHGVTDWECHVRESAGYSPWYFNMIPKGQKKYHKAWDMLTSSDGFSNTKGMTTAEKQHEMYNEHAYAWNGRGWPFQNSMVNKAYANYLKNYKKKVTGSDREILYRLIDQLVKLHGEEKNIGEYYLPSNSTSMGGVKDYFHSTFPDMLIEDLLGFTASHNDEFEIKSLLSDDKWEFFYLGNLNYHGYEVDIIWKKDWNKELKGNQSKLCVWVNGELKATSDSLEETLKVEL
jgi:hypothetical protein